MRVGEVAIDSVAKPLGDAADGKRCRRNEVRPCFRTTCPNGSGQTFGTTSRSVLSKAEARSADSSHPWKIVFTSEFCCITLCADFCQALRAYPSPTRSSCTGLRARAATRGSAWIKISPPFSNAIRPENSNLSWRLRSPGVRERGVGAFCALTGRAVRHGSNRRQSRASNTRAAYVRWMLRSRDNGAR
jgi:hypothetical protein